MAAEQEITVKIDPLEVVQGIFDLGDAGDFQEVIDCIIRNVDPVALLMAIQNSYRRKSKEMKATTKEKTALGRSAVFEIGEASEFDLIVDEIEDIQIKIRELEK